MLKFKQSDWIKVYIDFNTQKGKNAANCFKKNFFKLMINSAYGKTMKIYAKESMLKHWTVKDYLKHVSKPTFISTKICDKNCAAIHEIKPVLTLNKPIYVRILY